jgi:hypothetical protein
MKATQLSKGMFRVLDITYQSNGTSIVKAISEWLPVPAECVGRVPKSEELVRVTTYEGIKFDE